MHTDQLDENVDEQLDDQQDFDNAFVDGGEDVSRNAIVESEQAEQLAMTTN